MYLGEPVARGHQIAPSLPSFHRPADDWQEPHYHIIREDWPTEFKSRVGLHIDNHHTRVCSEEGPSVSIDLVVHCDITGCQHDAVLRIEVHSLYGGKDWTLD